MEKYLAAFLLMITASISAKNIQGSVPIVCADEKEFVEAIVSFDEEPFITALSKRDLGNGLLTPTALVIFLNPKTGSFTVAEKISDMYCVVAMGENMKPYLDEENTAPRKGT
jgi:hypothetical protein